MTLADAYGAFAIAGIVVCATLCAECMLLQHLVRTLLSTSLTVLPAQNPTSNYEFFEFQNFPRETMRFNRNAVLTWMLVYSTDAYKKACDRVKELNKHRTHYSPYLY